MTLKTETEVTDQKKIGVYCGIPLPWPQDRPPEEKVLQGFMSEKEETRESYDLKNGNGSDRS